VQIIEVVDDIPADLIAGIRIFRQHLPKHQTQVKRQGANTIGRPSSFFPKVCSGDMQEGVPATLPFPFFSSSIMIPKPISTNFEELLSA